MRSRLLDPDEMAAVSNMDRLAVLRLAREGKIPCVRFSRKAIRFDLDAVLEALSAPAKPRPEAARPGGAA